MPGLILIGLPAAGVPFSENDLQTVRNATPVDSGYMESRWEISADGFSLVNDADYAAYVEFGHHARDGSEVEGQHFVYSVLEEILADMYEREPELLDDYELAPGEMEIFVGF